MMMKLNLGAPGAVSAQAVICGDQVYRRTRKRDERVVQKLWSNRRGGCCIRVITSISCCGLLGLLGRPRDVRQRIAQGVEIQPNERTSRAVVSSPPWGHACGAPCVAAPAAAEASTWTTGLRITAIASDSQTVGSAWGHAVFAAGQMRARSARRPSASTRASGGSLRFIVSSMSAAGSGEDSLGHGARPRGCARGAEVESSCVVYACGARRDGLWSGITLAQVQSPWLGWCNPPCWALCAGFPSAMLLDRAR